MREPIMAALSETSHTAPLHRGCPLCGGEFPHPLFAAHGFTFLECPCCSFHFVGEKLPEERLCEYYDRGYFQGGDTHFGYGDYQEIEANKGRTFERRLRSLEAALAGRGRLLDVVARRKGWDAYGIDISAYAARAANRRTNGRCFCATPYTAPFQGATFDAVTLFDCIEHVDAPVAFLNACAGLLKPGGLLLVETPNVGGGMSRVMGRRWPYYRPPEHLVYFSPKTLERAFALAGCEMLSWRPSLKCVDLAYISSEMRASNPLLSRLLGQLSRCAPGVWNR